MNATKLTLAAIGIALVTTAATLSLFSGCSSSGNSEPAPTIRDSGPESSTHSDSGHDATGDTAPTETSIPDTGSCSSDSSACNTCYTDAQTAQDPLNACSAYTKNCVPVSLTVPSHPTITP